MLYKMQQQKKPIQLKKCQGGCNKEYPSLWKTLTIDGVRKKCCQNCTKKLEVRKVKEKTEKAKQKRREQRAKITDKKIHDVFAKLIKDIYPLHCHACYVPLTKGTIGCQACHFVSRGRKIVTWDIRNVLPGCSTCNGFRASHVYELGKSTNKYWGEGTAEELRLLEVKDYNWSQYQKNCLYELFSNPPQARTLEETRRLILEKYFDIKNENT
jgi:hypothetical protein